MQKEYYHDAISCDNWEAVLWLRALTLMCFCYIALVQKEERFWIFKAAKESPSLPGNEWLQLQEQHKTGNKAFADMYNQVPNFFFSY
jgi:hypothetical protein